MAIKLYMAINAENEETLKEFFEKQAFQVIKEDVEALHGIPLKNGYVSCHYIKDNEAKKECTNLVFFQLDMKRFMRTGRMRDEEKKDELQSPPIQS